MLKIGQCFLILIKRGNEYDMLNSFYPHESKYDHNEVHRLYNKVQKHLSNWYYHYYNNRDGQISLGIGTTFENGTWSLEKVI